MFGDDTTRIESQQALRASADKGKDCNVKSTVMTPDLEPVFLHLEVNDFPEDSFRQLHQLVVVPAAPKLLETSQKQQMSVTSTRCQRLTTQQNSAGHGRDACHISRKCGKMVAGDCACRQWGQGQGTISRHDWTKCQRQRSHP